MPHVDPLLGNERVSKKVLTISMEEDDPILPSIRKAMEGHGIRECSAMDVEGQLKEGTLSYTHQGQQRYQVVRNTGLLHASGRLKVSYGDLYGGLTITTSERAPITGLLLRGAAAGGLSFKFAFTPEEGRE